MTKFVPKEVLGDSTFVAVYDPESGDTGYVRMGDLVNKSETTVTAVTSPGGGITASAGGAVLAGFVPADIALIGDSRTLGTYLDWSVSVISPSGVPRAGQYAQLLGAQAGAALNETGLYEYDHATGKHRWTCGADVPGPWQNAVVGRHLLESGSPGRGLRMMLWRPHTANISDAVTLAGTRTHHWRSYFLNRGGLLDDIESEFWGATVKMLGAGGGHTRDMVTMLPYFEREAGGAGVDVWWCGTNDINNDRPAADIIAFAQTVLDARLALGRRIVIIGEHARWGVDTSTPIDAGKQSIHAAYNAWLREYAAAHPGATVFIDALALTRDVAQTDLRPQAGVPGSFDMVYDTVHPWLGTKLLLHPLVIAAIRQFIGPAWQRNVTAKGADMIDFLGQSWWPGTDGTVTAPTTTTTGTPTGTTANQTANVTSSYNKTGFRSEPGVAVECVYSSTPGASQYTRIYTVAQTLIALGLSVGEWLQVECLCEVDLAGINDRIEIYATFNGSSIRASMQAPCTPGVYRMKTQPLQIPPGSTSINYRLELWTDTAAASSGKLRFGKFLARKVAPPPTF